MAEIHHHHSGMLLALVAVGGLYLYMRSRASAQATAPGAIQAPGGNPLGLSTLPATTPDAGAPNPGQQLPVATRPVQIPLTVTNNVVPPGIDPTVFATVQKWGLTDGRAPIINMLNANDPGEYAGMYNIIVNFWDAGIAPGVNELTFWNNLRTKYDPSHAIW